MTIRNMTIQHMGIRNMTIQHMSLQKMTIQHMSTQNMPIQHMRINLGARVMEVRNQVKIWMQCFQGVIDDSKVDIQQLW